MIPLMPSPGSPKTVSTPQSMSRSTSASDAIGATVASRSVKFLARLSRPGEIKREPG